METAAAKSASLSGSSNTFAATWLMEKLVIWSRKRGLSWAISLKTDTISDMKARIYWSSLLYGSVTRFSTLTMDISCLCKNAVWTGPACWNKKKMIRGVRGKGNTRS